MITKPGPMVWVDIETTGLDPTAPGAAILELGFKVTTSNLDVTDSVSWIVYLPDDALLAMSNWALEQHGRSGLLALARRSDSDMEKVDRAAENWLYSLVDTAGKIPMSGSSVHFDRAWLTLLMPRVAQWFHYRNIDVSTVKNLAQLWYPGLAKFNEDGVETVQHRSLPDLDNSIAELRYYRDRIFALPGVVTEGEG